MRTFRTIGIAGTVAALLLSAGAAFAQGPAANIYGERQGTENRMKTATTTRMNIGEARAMIASSTAERVQAAREKAQVRVAAVREKAAQRLADIQDKVKQQLAQKLAAQFDNLNKTWTDHFSQLLDRYSAILQKIQSRADTAAANGKDVTAATAAIQSAQTAIATAQTAVTAQAAKTYTLDTTTVTTATATTTPNGQSELMQKLRTAFQGLHSSLFKDLFALRDGSMTDARKAVQAALQALTQVPGIDEGNATATTTAQQ